MGDTINIEEAIMSNNEINQSSINENQAKQAKEIKLNKNERDKFHNEFESINLLIEQFLTEEGTEETSESTSLNTPIQKNSEPNSLEMKQSFNSPENAYKDKLRRIGLLKNDPTGKNLKAAGEDV